MKTEKLVFPLLVFLVLGSASAYTNWASSEPNQYNNQEEDCAHMYSNGEWNDQVCGQSNPGICEYNDGSYDTTSSMSWSNARSECNNRGGHLVVVDDSSENNFLQNNLASNDPWIGYYQSSSGSEPAGGWQWVVSSNSPPQIDPDTDGDNLPSPAQDTGTSPVSTQNPDLEVEVSDPNGDSMDVRFYGQGSFVQSARIAQWDTSVTSGANDISEMSQRMDDGSDVLSKKGETTINKIDCDNTEECDQFGSDSTYGTCVTGYIYAPSTGTYEFATDSDDASDFFIGVPSTSFDRCDSVSSGNRIASFYGSHAECGDPCWSHSGSTSLSSGYHSFIYRQNDDGGGDVFKLAWKKPSSGSFSIIPSDKIYHHSGTFIGSDTVSGSGTASKTWSGLSCGSTNDWYVVADDGGASTTSSTWTFSVDCDPPPQISSFSTAPLSGHAFSVNSLVTDADGESNIQSCELTVRDGEGNSNTSSISNPSGGSTSNDAECDFGPVRYTNNSGWGHTEQMTLELTVTDMDGKSNSQTIQNSFPNHQPSLSVSFQDYSSRHAFNATAVITDTDAPGDTEIDFCSMNFSDGEANYVYAEPSVNQGYGAADQASCTYSDINSSVSGFDVTEDISLEVNATDVHGSSKVSTFSHPVPNRPPLAVDPEPRDAGVVTEFPVKLNATVQDPEGDGSLDVTLYNDSLEAISSASGVSSGYEIQGEQESAGGAGKTYTWKIEVSDAWGVQNTTFTFIELIGTAYRSSIGIKLNYSSVILNAGNEEYVGLTVRNKVDNTKNLTVNLTGIEAEFMDGSKAKTFPNFQGRTQKKFTVRLTPDKATDKDLIVKVQNNEIGITTEEKLPVKTRESTKVTNQVPGITLLQLLVLFSAATVLYSVRL